MQHHSLRHIGMSTIPRAIQSSFLVLENPKKVIPVTLEFEAPYGMKFGEFDPDQTVRADGGTGVFTFENSESGVFDYQPSDWIVNAYGISAITTPVMKALGVAHPNPEIVELHIGWKLLTTTEREGDFPVCFNGAREYLLDVFIAPSSLFVGMRILNSL